jgi:P4 family phage/plasmid primase-like protien
VTDARGLPLWSDIVRKWGRTTEAQGKISAIAKLARPKLAVRVDRLDADPFAVNVLNGTLRFTREWVASDTGGRWKAKVERHPHRRKDLITKLAPVNYDPAALCPIYDDLIEWAQPKPAMRRYLHAWGGYSMSADAREQKLQFWYGMGGNGKSTVMDAWCAAYGDYSDTIPIESFLDQGIKKRGDQASPDLAKLAWVRLLRTSEPDEGGKLSTGLIKLVTGGEPVPVRHLNRGFFNLKVTFKLTISGNHKPDIRQTDNGIWRRVKLVAWEQSVRNEMNPDGTRDEDPELPAKLLNELDGIFLHLVKGLVDYLENRLVEPEDVTTDTMEYRTENDPLARFLKLCTTPDPAATARSSKLYELFVAWCKVADETEWKQKGFSRAMLAKGYKKKQSDGMYWLGIRQTREPDEFVDPQTGRPKAFSLDDEPIPAPPTRPPDPGDRDYGGWGSDDISGLGDDDPPL